jgi:hypothetical protein
MAKGDGKERANTVENATEDTAQESPTIQEQADSVLSGEATLVDHGQQSAEADERRRAEEDRMAEEAERSSGTTSGKTADASRKQG